MPDEKRRTIIDAALRVFAKSGFAAARISDIAVAAGVGKGTVYLYFASKEDLLIGVLESYADDILSMIDELALAGVTPEEGIRIFFETTLGLNVDLLSIIEQRLFISNDDLQARGKILFRSLIERLVAKISSNIGNGFVADYDLEIIATAVISAFSSVRLYRVLHPEETQNEAVSKVSAELSRFFSAALLSPSN